MNLEEIKKNELRLIIKEKYQSKKNEWSGADYIRLERDFEENMNIIYLKAQEIYKDLLVQIKPEHVQAEVSAFKNILKKTFTSEKYKIFFNDLSINGYTLEDKIDKLKADSRSVGSFLKDANFKGSTKDFFAVCLGKKGWKDFISEIDDFDTTDYIKALPSQVKREEKTSEADKTDLNLDFVANHSISRSENLIDAFNAGLHNFFINYFENYDKKISNKEFSSKNTFPVLFKSLHFDELFSFETFNLILKRLKINKYNLDNESSPFDDEETQAIFVIGNLIADRIFNRVAIDLYGDSEHSYNRRVEIDNTILSVLAWLDIEYIYLNTIENYNAVEPHKVLKFISEFKGIIRKKHPYKETSAEIGNFISKVYHFGLESKLEEIISYKESNKFEEVDFFISQIQEVHTRDNIEYFTKLENTNDLEEIKQKIHHSFLKDFFVLGELIAQDLIACLVFSTQTIYETEEEFEEDMSLRKIEEIENLSISLNLQAVYNSYMPKLYYDDKRCKLEGNYNVFLMKILKQIKNLN